MEVLSAAAMLTGAVLVLLAAIGMVRLPDLFTRMQAATKAGTVGVGLLLTSVALRFSELEATAWVLLVIVFMVLTAPVAAHLIARVAYLTGVPLWSGTVRDELAERLRSQGPTDAPPPAGGDLNR